MRIAIAQIAMHWTTSENVAAIQRAMGIAKSAHADLCCFSELAISGFHREIAREAKREIVTPALDAIAESASRLSLAVAVGAPAITPDNRRFIAHYLINETGTVVAEIHKRGLTDPEATFFCRGEARPIADLRGLRCTAVICREIEDLEHIEAELPSEAVDVLLVPGALRQDPEKPRSDPPPYVENLRRLASATGAWVVHTNWPNALNRPEESVDSGGSNVVSPKGELMFRLPMQRAGIGVFTLGERLFEWIDE
jgi:predicted amidohydrolase